MSTGERMSDRQIWEHIKEQHGEGPFQFREVAELCDPERAYAFMQRAVEEAWILEADEEGNLYRLNLDTKPEESPPPRPAGVPTPPTEFKEWYRGTKFHLSRTGFVTWWTPRKVARVTVTAGFEGLLDKIQGALPLGGTFRVDEQARVLAKDPDHDYRIVSLGKLKGKIQFDVIERDPRNRVKPGYIWPSIYDGARYHFSPDGKVWFRYPDGTRRFAKSGQEGLVEPLKKFKAEGGSFRITETGRILTLKYKLPVPEAAKDQWNSMTDEERRLIKAREDLDPEFLIPIFVGDFKGKIELGDVFDIHKPWSEEEKDEFFQVLASRTEGGT